MSTLKTILLVVGVIAVIIIGFIIIPPLMKKYGNKIYKFSLKKDYIDFDNMGPEIVKKEDKDDREGN